MTLIELQTLVDEVSVAWEPWSVVSAGANPQRGGGFSAPLQHGKCSFCGAKRSELQWEVLSHPENDCLYVRIRRAASRPLEETK